MLRLCRMDAKHTDKSTAVNKNFDGILPPEQDLRDVAYATASNLTW